MLECPRCHGRRVVGNDFSHNGRQNHCRNDCGRRFLKNPRKGRISDQRPAVVDALLAAAVQPQGQQSTQLIQVARTAGRSRLALRPPLQPIPTTAHPTEGMVFGKSCDHRFIAAGRGVIA